MYPPSIRGCASITRNIQRTADIRKEPKGQPVNMSIRGYSKDVPLLWISDQAAFEPQSRRMQADTFLVKPVTEYQLREAVSQLLQKTTRRNEPREEDE